MKFLTILMLCSRLVSAALASDSESKTAITSATEKYVAANSAISSMQVTVDKVEGGFARAKVTPRNGETDAAWVFLKKQNGSWTGLTLGTSFTPEDYRELGIPRSLWIK